MEIGRTLRNIMDRIAGRYASDMHLALELTDFCNCNCIMCSQSAVKVIHGSKKGFIEDALVRRLIMDLEESGWKIHKFLPFALGESLLHPNFAEIMRFILERNRKSRLFQTVDLHTNAILLHGDNARVLLDYSDQIDTLSFSLDAVNPDTYKVIRRNPHLKSAERNIETFIRERKRRGLNRPRLHFQFIVMEENANEAGEFLNRWKGFLDREGIESQVNYDWYPAMTKDTIFFKRLNPFRNSDVAAAEALHRKVAIDLGLVQESEEERIIRSNEFVEGEADSGSASGAAGHGDNIPIYAQPADRENDYESANSAECAESFDKSNPEKHNESDSEKHNESDSEKHEKKPIDTKVWEGRRPCAGPWKYINISWDGEVTVCCIDTGRELSLGNIHKKSINQLWTTGLIEDYRLWQIRGEFGRMPKCTICRNLDSPMMSDKEVLDYLEARELYEDIENYKKRFNLSDIDGCE